MLESKLPLRSLFTMSMDLLGSMLVLQTQGTADRHPAASGMQDFTTDLSKRLEQQDFRDVCPMS